jgi:hypothetical protein
LGYPQRRSTPGAENRLAEPGDFDEIARRAWTANMQNLEA